MPTIAPTMDTVKSPPMSATVAPTPRNIHRISHPQFSGWFLTMILLCPLVCGDEQRRHPCSAPFDGRLYDIVLESGYETCPKPLWPFPGAERMLIRMPAADVSRLRWWTVSNREFNRLAPVDLVVIADTVTRDSGCLMPEGECPLRCRHHRKGILEH
jgi:hypothetical protein